MVREAELWFGHTHPGCVEPINARYQFCLVLGISHKAEWGKVRDHDDETSTQHMRPDQVIKLNIQNVSVISSL